MTMAANYVFYPPPLLFYPIQRGLATRKCSVAKVVLGRCTAIVIVLPLYFYAVAMAFEAVAIVSL